MEQNTQQTPAEMPQPQQTPESKETSPYLVPGSILASGIIIALAIYFAFHGFGSQPTSLPPGATAGMGAGQGQTAGAATVNIKNVNTTNEPYIGQAHAPVTIAFWSDYQCPFCKQFELGTLPTIIKNYVDTGKVKIIFKDYEFLGNDSQSGGIYARAVWKLYPQQYFTWRTAMYNAQDAEGDVGFGNPTTIIALTKTIPGIDATKVQADVAANTAAYQAELDADKTEGSNFGIQGTPAFIIGTQLIPGALPYSSFSSVIDAQLKK